MPARCLMCLLWLAALICLGSCGSGDAAPQVRRIIYWEKWTGFEGAAMQAVVDAFNTAEKERAAAERGYIPIEVEMVTISGLDQKLLVATAGGNPPDVAGAWTWMVYSYSEKGALTDLGPFLQNSELNADHYLPVFWDMCQYRGSTWCLPTTPASTALHWNKRLFREAGLDPEQPPRSLEELDRFAQQLTVWDELDTAGDSVAQHRGWAADLPALADGHQYRLRQVGFLPNEPNWWPWAWGFYFGGQLWDQGQITATHPDNIAALEWAHSYAKRLGPDTLNRFTSGFGSFSTPQNPFMNGTVAMEIQGVWMYNFIDKYAPGLRWGAAPFPVPAAKGALAGAGNVEADVIIIPAGSKHPQEAWQFMEFVSSQTGMELLCMGQRKFSPLAQESASFQSQHPHPALGLFRDLAANRNGFSTPKMGIWNEYKRELGRAFERVMNGSAKPADALQTVQDRIAASWQRHEQLRLVRSQQ